MIAINEAYEVLSDPNERTWYDNHRNQILSGKGKTFLYKMKKVRKILQRHHLEEYRLKSIKLIIAIQDLKMIKEDSIKFLEIFLNKSKVKN